MRIIFIVLFFTKMSSCTNNTNADKENSDSSLVQNPPGINGSIDPPATKSQMADANGCFMGILKRDTFALHLDQTGTSVSGKLTFNNFEKDKSTGSVHGVVDGDIIKLWYDFASEGIKSVMEVYFKTDGNHLLRGIAPLAVKSDTTYFTDHSAIEYDVNQSFNKLSCDELPGKFK